MRPNQLVAMSAVLLATTALGACTSTKSTASDSRSTSAPITSSLTQHAAAISIPSGPGATHLTDYAANTDGSTSTVILTGAIGDYGTATFVHPDGRVDPEHTGLLELALTHGTFRLNLTDLHASLVKAFAHFPTNATCSGTITATAMASIVAGSGTGEYTHASGGFDLTVTIDEVDAKPTCDGTGTFLAQTTLVTGSAVVRLS